MFNVRERFTKSLKHEFKQTTYPSSPFLNHNQRIPPAEGPFALGDNDVFLYVAMCEQLQVYIDDNETHL